MSECHLTDLRLLVRFKFYTVFLVFRTLGNGDAPYSTLAELILRFSKC